MLLYFPQEKGDEAEALVELDPIVQCSECRAIKWKKPKDFLQRVSDLQKKDVASLSIDQVSRKLKGFGCKCGGNFQIQSNPLAKLSLTWRDCKALDEEREGTYLLIKGQKEKCKLAAKKLGELSEKIEANEKERVIKKIEEQEERSLTGLGKILK